MPEKRTIPRVCRCCGRDFLASVGKVRIGLGLYCSDSCSRARRPQNILVSEDGLTGSIPLYARDGAIRGRAVIDADDVVLVGEWRWGITGGYVARRALVSGRHRIIYLHRYLLGLTHGDGLEGDHMDRDHMNNRRSNLRIATHPQNSQNTPGWATATSKHRGVHWHKDTGKWQARITINGKGHHIGLFTSESEAAEAARSARQDHMPYAVD